VDETQSLPWAREAFNKVFPGRYTVVDRRDPGVITYLAIVEEGPERGVTGGILGKGPLVMAATQLRNPVLISEKMESTVPSWNTDQGVHLIGKS